MGLADADLEPLQVDLPQRPFAQDAVGVIAVILLVVAGEMLDGGIGPLVGLHAFDHRGGDLPAQQRVLAVIFKVPPAQRIAVDVQRRRQPVSDVEFIHLHGDGLADPLAELRVPGLCHAGAHGEGGAVLVTDLLPFRVRHDDPFDPAGKIFHESHQVIRHADQPPFESGAPHQPQPGRAVGEVDIDQPLVEKPVRSASHGARRQDLHPGEHADEAVADA